MACRQTTLPYGNAFRTLQVDMVAYDAADAYTRAYEMKRGNDQFAMQAKSAELKCV
jgi:hypothetical protein